MRAKNNNLLCSYGTSFNDAVRTKSVLSDILLPKVLIFLSAFFSAGSFLLFDSAYVKNFSYYPVVFYTLSLLSFLLFALALNYNFSTLNKASLPLILTFLALIFIGSAMSMLVGHSSPVTLFSKSFVIVLNLMNYSLGLNSSKSASKTDFFSKSFLICTVLLCIVGYNNTNYNQNWVALLLLFATLLIILRDSQNVFFLFVQHVVLIGGGFWFSWAMCGARGVAVAFLLLLVSLIFASIGCISPMLFFKLLKKISLLTLLMAFFITICGIYVYNDSAMYKELTSQSFKMTGKSLDSSRLQRWSEAYDLTLANSPIFGLGLDASLVRLSNNIGAWGDLHNIFLEYFFRFGLFGILILFGVVYMFIRSLIIIDIRGCIVTNVVIFISCVYGIGGFTHWPATFLLWYILGLIKGRQNC